MKGNVYEKDTAQRRLTRVRNEIRTESFQQ